MIDVVAALAMLPMALCSAYLAALTALAFAPGRRATPAAPPRARFTVVIPAHNEESTLPGLLASIAAADYPRDLVEVHVIADNCDDATAGEAGRAGVTVHERFDQALRAKGYAIEWLLSRPGFDLADAAVFIDADCVVSANLFEALNSALSGGAEAIQVYYDVRDADASASLQLRQVALALVHLLRPAAKMRIGASAGLKGTGMCFTRDVMQRVPWRAHGLAEDVEHHLRLLDAGVRVSFVREARVSGHMGRSLAASGEQHRRWEAGRLHAIRADVPRLLRRGVREGNIAMIDAAVEQLTPPISILAAAIAAGLAIGSIFDLAMTRALAAASALALVAYVAGGVIMLRPRPMSLVRAMAVAPFYIGWKALTYARALTTGRDAAWVRTTRDEAA